MTGANIIVAIFSEKESHAVYFLSQQNMTRLDAVQYISHGIAKIQQNNENDLRRINKNLLTFQAIHEKSKNALDAILY